MIRQISFIFIFLLFISSCTKPSFNKHVIPSVKQTESTEQSNDQIAPTVDQSQIEKPCEIEDGTYVPVLGMMPVVSLYYSKADSKLKLGILLDQSKNSFDKELEWIDVDFDKNSNEECAVKSEYKSGVYFKAKFDQLDGRISFNWIITKDQNKTTVDSLLESVEIVKLRPEVLAESFNELRDYFGKNVINRYFLALTGYDLIDRTSFPHQDDEFDLPLPNFPKLPEPEIRLPQIPDEKFEYPIPSDEDDLDELPPLPSERDYNPIDIPSLHPPIVSLPRAPKKHVEPEKPVTPPKPTPEPVEPTPEEKPKKPSVDVNPRESLVGGKSNWELKSLPFNELNTKITQAVSHSLTQFTLNPEIDLQETLIDLSHDLYPDGRITVEDFLKYVDSNEVKNNILSSLDSELRSRLRKTIFFYIENIQAPAELEDVLVPSNVKLFIGDTKLLSKGLGLNPSPALFIPTTFYNNQIAVRSSLITPEGKRAGFKAMVTIDQVHQYFNSIIKELFQCESIIVIDEEFFELNKTQKIEDWLKFALSQYTQFVSQPDRYFISSQIDRTKVISLSESLEKTKKREDYGQFVLTYSKLLAESTGNSVELEMKKIEQQYAHFHELEYKRFVALISHLDISKEWEALLRAQGAESSKDAIEQNYKDLTRYYTPVSYELRVHQNLLEIPMPEVVRQTLSSK